MLHFQADREVLLLISAIALVSFVPARRPIQINPATALRSE
jgi:hypothetical protein